MAALKVSSRKVDADALRAADFLQRGRRPRLALHHFGEQGQPDADDLAFLGQARQRLAPGTPFGPWSCRRASREACRRPAQTPPALSGRGPGRRDRPAARVLAFNKANLQLPHEPADGHPEIIPHHDDALHPAAVALPQGLHQFGVLFLLLGVQPLLELVEDDHAPSCPAGMPCPRRRAASVSFRPRSSGRPGSASQAVQQAGLRLVGGGLDVDGDHVVGQAGAAGPPSPATTCRNPTARRSSPRRRCCRRPFLRCGSSRTEYCRAARLGPEVPAAVRGRSRHRGRRTTASPFGTILMG